MVNVFGLISALMYLCIGLLNDSSTGLSLIEFFVMIALLFAISAYLAYATHEQSHKISLNTILLWAVVFRGIGIVFSPIYEDDHFRFLWDGFVFYEYGTPYGIAPSALFGSVLSPDPHLDERLQNILGQINYPDTPTVYGPVFQLSFLLNYVLFPGDVIGLKLLFVGCDMGLIFLLKNWAPKAGVLLYAWSPLVIKEIAFTAHPDILAILFLVGCFVALQCNFSKIALCLLAVAICTKIFALLMLPFVLTRCNWKQWWLLPVIVLMIYTPFILSSGKDLGIVWAFSLDWQFNGSVHWVLSQWLRTNDAKLLCLMLFGLLFFSYWLHFTFDKSTLIPRGDWIYGWFFLLSPVVNAWYFIWVLVFAAIRPNRWAWGASLLLMLSYITGVTTSSMGLQLYEQPLWARALEYGGIMLLVIWDFSSKQGTLPSLKQKKPQLDHS